VFALAVAAAIGFDAILADASTVGARVA